MPLIRCDNGPTPPPAAEAGADLRSPEPERRRAVARDLAGRPEALADLAAALAAESCPSVREALFTALIRIGGAAAVERLLPFLGSDDAGLRTGATEALQAMPEAVEPYLARLLGDPDPDVRIQAVEVARALPSAAATRLLGACLEREEHANVAAAAVDVLAEAGTAEAIAPLEGCARRFAADPFLAFAVRAAVGRIRGGG